MLVHNPNNKNCLRDYERYVTDQEHAAMRGDRKYSLHAFSQHKSNVETHKQQQV